MKNLLLKIAYFVSSPRLTAALLLYAALFVFAATLEIPALGIGETQARYFEAWFAMWGWIPLFGGKSVGLAALVNLLASSFRFCRSGVRGLGFAMVHIALVLLILSGFMQSLWRTEGFVAVREGESSDKLVRKGPGGAMDASETLPFSIELVKFTRTSWQNTDLPSHFSSLVKFRYEDISQEKLIKMNEPASFGSWTFYQSSYADGGKTSVLQAVRNPAGLLPWISIILIFAGMLFAYAYKFLVPG